MTKDFNVSVSMNQAAPVKTGVVLKQGDFGFDLKITVLDFSVTGTTPQIVFRKPMGSVESTDVTASGNVYTYTFKGTELDTPGKVFCDLKLKNSTTQRISTASFQFECIADTLDGLAEESSSYSDTIEQIVGGFDEEINTINNHLDALDNGFISANVSMTKTNNLQKMDYSFVSGNKYKIKVSFSTSTTQVQFGSLDGSNNTWIDSSEVMTFTDTPLEFEFEASANASIFAVYSAKKNITLNYTIYDYSKERNVRFDISQNLTTGEKTQARNNINAASETALTSEITARETAVSNLNNKVYSNTKASDSSFTEQSDSLSISTYTTRFTYPIKEGNYYKIRVSFSESVGTVQMGTTNITTSLTWIDSSPVMSYTDADLEYAFKATTDAQYFAVYSGKKNITMTYSFIDFSKILKNIDSNFDFESENPIKNAVITNTLYTKKILVEETTSTNGLSKYRFKIVKGKRYLIHAEAAATNIQVGTLDYPGTNYVDSSPVYHGTVSFDYDFVASENASWVGIYGDSNDSKTIKLYQIDSPLDTKPESKTNQPIDIYRFTGTKDEILSCESWTQNTGYITLNHSGDLFVDGAVVQKYSTAYNRVITYDFAPYEDSVICGYTQRAGQEYFWKQGWCVTVNFSNMTLNIHNKYGEDNSSAISQTLRAIQKTVSFTVSSYIGKKFRLEMERTEDRGLKASLYRLEDLSLIASIYTDFEAETVPSYGLGYDCAAITATSGSVDLFGIDIKIKSANNCFLYIIGDSITEGVAVYPERAWAYMIANQVGNTIVSGRGGGTINGVLQKIDDEAAKIKPKYIMVTIGTNGGNTSSKLNQLKTKIETLGAIPIINCIPCMADSAQASINEAILQIETDHVRFDIATAIDNDIQSGQNTNLFISDYVHPNEDGYIEMVKRVKIDCPYLFNT